MIRRMKSDVLSELPAKRRQLVRIQIDVKGRGNCKKDDELRNESRSSVTMPGNPKASGGEIEQEGGWKRENEETERGGFESAEEDVYRDDDDEVAGNRNSAARTKYKAVGLAKVEEGVKW